MIINCLLKIAYAFDIAIKIILITAYIFVLKRECKLRMMICSRGKVIALTLLELSAVFHTPFFKCIYFFFVLQAEIIPMRGGNDFKNKVKKKRRSSIHFGNRL